MRSSERPRVEGETAGEVVLRFPLLVFAAIVLVVGPWLLSQYVLNPLEAKPG